MRYHLKLEWEDEGGTKQSVEIGEIETTACQSAADVGVSLSTGRALLTQLQQVVIQQQLQTYCELSRPCPTCHAVRHIKDHRTRTLDTVLGRVVVDAPRFDACHSFCQGQGVISPLSSLLPARLLPELQQLQAKVAALLPYRKAAALLRELLPETGGLSAMTTRS